MTRFEDARNRFTAQLPARRFDFESKPPATGWFPARTCDLELHPRPHLPAVARAKIRAHPLPYGFPRGSFDRARPRAVARPRYKRARSHAVTYAEDSIAPVLTRLPTQGANAPASAQLPTRKIRPCLLPRAVAHARTQTRSSCAPEPSRSCPRSDSDAPDPLAVTYGGFERLETPLAVARVMISSSGHSLVDHLAVARSMICVRVAERLR
jgi:hypothetical protein